MSYATKLSFAMTVIHWECNSDTRHHCWNRKSPTLGVRDHELKYRRVTQHFMTGGDKIEK